MSLRTQYEFLFVGRDEDSFVENYAYDLGDGGEAGGKIFINLEIQNNQAEAEDMGELIFDTLRKKFFADLDEDPYIRFEKALKEVNRELKNLRAQKSSQFIGNLHVIIAAVVGNNIFLTQCGEAEAYLIRRKFCSVISDDLYDPESKDYFTNIANGSMEAEDFVLLSSTRLLRHISKADFARISASRNLVAILGELRDFLAAEVLGKMGFIGIRTAFAAELNEKEMSRATNFLQQHEGGSGDSKGKQPMNAVLMGHVKKLTAVAKNLSQRLVAVSARVRRKTDEGQGRVVRGQSGKNFFAFTSWSRDKILVSIILILVVLAASVWLLRSRADEQGKIDKYQTILTEVREKISSAETTGQFNKEQASLLLADAEQKALTVLNSGYLRSDAKKALELIQVDRDKLDGVMHPQTRVLADLSTKRANVKALGLLGLKKNLYVFEYNAIYPILANQVQDPITIDQNETVQYGSAFDDKNSLLFYTKSGKVIEYKDNQKTFIQTPEGAYHKGVDVEAYNNKLYILDPESNQIWKYTNLRDKFDAPQKYNIDADLKNAVSIAIDGNVYVANNDGSIIKLFGGSKQILTLKRQPVKPIIKPTQIFTQLDMQQVYLLESSTNRVIVYSKDSNNQSLTYQSQYIFDAINEIRSIYVDKDTNKLYLQDDTKVYEADLNASAPVSTTTTVVPLSPVVPVSTREATPSP